MTMVVPVRYRRLSQAAAKGFSCGKVIGDKWEEFVRRVKGGELPKEALDSLGVTRYCCRRMMLSHIQSVEELGELYQKDTSKMKEEKEFGDSS